MAAIIFSSPRERLAFSRNETSVDPSARSSITPTQSLDLIVRGRAASGRIAHLLTRPVGRPPHEVRRSFASFRYQAQTWSRSRRVVAKVE